MNHNSDWTDRDKVISTQLSLLRVLGLALLCAGSEISMMTDWEEAPLGTALTCILTGFTGGLTIPEHSSTASY